MKVAKKTSFLLLMLVAKGSYFTAPFNTESLSRVNSRELQGCPTSGHTYNTCASCCGKSFNTKNDLVAAIKGYPANKDTYGEMNCWDVSSVTEMSFLFASSPLNEPIRCWDVSKVTTMSGMFYYAASFNQTIADWNVSKVITMNTMFYSAAKFNQAIGNWNVTKVTNMNTMFYSATNFNQPIDN